MYSPPENSGVLDVSTCKQVGPRFKEAPALRYDRNYVRLSEPMPMALTPLMWQVPAWIKVRLGSRIFHGSSANTSSEG